MAKAATKSIYFFSATHWDREWNDSFQGFRNRLVTMMNGMIDCLETDPAFKVFHLDGQSISGCSNQACQP